MTKRARQPVEGRAHGISEDTSWRERIRKTEKYCNTDDRTQPGISSMQIDLKGF
jgi:hypothetical protein